MRLPRYQKFPRRIQENHEPNPEIICAESIELAYNRTCFLSDTLKYEFRPFNYEKHPFSACLATLILSALIKI